ncbi:unnamed protein product [Paramecium primaurelia]|uniref:Uncharacterized protein n=1 Tax=Paramecium primaurelia TaxID=5886 RepID=A0A8S1P964_PARPR|nr:unnamed protein product [Paramecium primaurelia]
MHNQIKTKQNLDRQNLYFADNKITLAFCQYERIRPFGLKQNIEFDSDYSDPPTKMIDITKLPNGQFKDRRYMHNDESFFVKMGGKNRELIAQKIRSRLESRQSPMTYRESPIFDQQMIKKAIKCQQLKQSNSARFFRVQTPKLSPISRIEVRPISGEVKDDKNIPQFSSAQQKLFRILLKK